MKMDQKYKGEVFKNNGTPVPEDEWIVFRAKDLALVETLEAYHCICTKLYCPNEHLDGIIRLKDRVVEFQNNNPERCKIPD